ncbi:T9SS type A sorting domain-containing protein [Natronoflexus pectinivorans]|uniref:Putative secreted protein (Por secretion system target) n=1 Tax=Natronoflexus pectinivorans TaxID=682526 RepID=A0A4R2GS53_9BACT|nr:YCF48-related protein [Natronoflexus pectinivorans]TCO11026.1 putative secreted protein (Por secretion system target) [Natronoflexus pectinivorans]
MKKLLLITAILCYILSATAQWQWINPMPPETHYKSVAHVTEQTYVTMGESLILKTQDEGRTWTQTEHPPVTNLNKVLFVNAETGFVVGDDGLLLKSSDGGDSWQEMNTGTKSSFWDVYFVNEQLGFISANAGQVFKTIDGGKNWTQQEMPDVWQHLRLIKFFDENTGYVASMHGLFAKTINGGEVWKVVEEELSFYYIYDMHLVDAQTILLASYGGIFKSTDGGETWQEKLAPSDEEIEAFSFINETTGYALGQLSRIYKTTDGGETWVNTNLLPDYFVSNVMEKGIAFGSEHTGIVVCWDNITWLDMQANAYDTPVQTIITQDLRDAAFTNDTTIVAVGRGLIAQSNTNGRTWSIQAPVQFGDYYYKIHFINENIGFSVGENFAPNIKKGVIIKTIDGGNNWELNFAIEQELRDVHFVNLDTGYVVGSGGTIYKTTNGGNEWVAQDSGVEVSLNSVFFTDTKTGYACGMGGTIIQTTNGGDTWTIASTPTTDAMFAISFFNDSIGFASVRGWGMAKTINAGKNWTWFRLPGSRNRIMRDMVFTSEKDGYIAGWDYLFTTNDGGETWELEQLSGGASISGIAVRNKNTIIGVGHKGTILRKYTGPEETPIDEEEDNSPTNIKFPDSETITFSVYPNPFSHVINIKGTFKENSCLIEIYDLNGRRLLDRNYSTASGNLTIDTSGLNAGVYLLRITDGATISTHKIVKTHR